ncbi:hypothetical protein [Aeromicrobium sp. Leaf291]|uniref:hypothetical protein n=1 Tax=Aeromicrobium sp. Leaf291 TaxID=1736325 RepID=UPI0007019A06|nr:hypothetical protein [Aeromicrobium sp. Leaf291]KQP81884.1 hypothetical protein ASF35_10455 [Aeromicrobium sp. Leaf291]
MTSNPDPSPADEPSASSPGQSSVAPRGRARTLLAVAGAVVSAQALGLLTIAALELRSVEADRVGLGVSTAGFLGAFGALLLVAVVRILAGQTWPRGFLVFSQLLCLVLSFNFRGDAAWITPTMAVGALVALGCLVSPPVTQALGGHDPV